MVSVSIEIIYLKIYITRVFLKGQATHLRRDKPARLNFGSTQKISSQDTPGFHAPALRDAGASLSAFPRRSVGTIGWGYLLRVTFKLSRLSG